MNSSMESYHQMVVNQQQDNWLEWMLLAKFADNNGASKTMKCTLFFPVQGVDPQSMFSVVTKHCSDHCTMDVYGLERMVQQIHE